mmetsp:Transcript_4011/g.7685  ORF Transcript_4011/g.7685 Transcript_4011/m.7685 type:complete len:232 (-) Transcript_4011:539-1234(-)
MLKFEDFRNKRNITDRSKLWLPFDFFDATSGSSLYKRILSLLLRSQSPNQLFLLNAFHCFTLWVLCNVGESLHAVAGNVIVFVCAPRDQRFDSHVFLHNCHFPSQRNRDKCETTCGCYSNSVVLRSEQSQDQRNRANFYNLVFPIAIVSNVTEYFTNSRFQRRLIFGASQRNFKRRDDVGFHGFLVADAAFETNTLPKDFKTLDLDGVIFFLQDFQNEFVDQVEIDDRFQT